MVSAALAVFAAIAVGLRALYPRIVERRALIRRPVGPDGIVVGAGRIELTRPQAPGVLLLHGAGDTPQVLSDLAQHLYDRGYSVCVPLLSGHGRAISDFTKVSASQWHDDVRREYASMRLRHEWSAIVGLSMGGALAITFAAEHPELPALVLLAPYASMPPALRRAAASSTIWGVAYPYFSSGGSQSIRDAAAARRGLGHGMFTPAALRALNRVVVAASAALPQVTVPTLMIQSQDDNRISRAEGEHTFARLGSSQKRLVWTAGAGHVITVDFGHEKVFGLVSDWLDAHRP